MNNFPLALRLEAYGKLAPNDRTRIDRLTSRTVREIGPRRDFLREGESPRSMFVVLDGWGCRYKTLPDGRRQIVAFFLPGDICDLKAYVLGEMDHSIGAITPFRVAEIGPDEFETMIEEHPRVTRALYWDGLVSLATQREWTLNVGQRTAYERLAHLLCELFIRLEMVGLTNGNSCDFPLTQVDLADATGLTAVHVNRTLQELRRDALIELQSRTLTIPDLDRLKGAGLFNANYLHLNAEGRHLETDD
jgi:CRP-like cAMP-binding protein